MKNEILGREFFYPKSDRRSMLESQGGSYFTPHLPPNYPHPSPQTPLPTTLYSLSKLKPLIFALLYTLVDDLECPWTMNCFYSLKFVFLSPFTPTTAHPTTLSHLKAEGCGNMSLLEFHSKR